MSLMKSKSQSLARNSSDLAERNNPVTLSHYSVNVKLRHSDQGIDFHTVCISSDGTMDINKVAESYVKKNLRMMVRGSDPPIPRTRRVSEVVIMDYYAFTRADGLTE